MTVTIGGTFAGAEEMKAWDSLRTVTCHVLSNGREIQRYNYDVPKSWTFRFRYAFPDSPSNWIYTDREMTQELAGGVLPAGDGSDSLWITGDAPKVDTLAEKITKANQLSVLLEKYGTVTETNAGTRTYYGLHEGSPAAFLVNLSGQSESGESDNIKILYGGLAYEQTDGTWTLSYASLAENPDDPDAALENAAASALPWAEKKSGHTVEEPEIVNYAESVPSYIVTTVEHVREAVGTEEERETVEYDVNWTITLNSEDDSLERVEWNRPDSPAESGAITFSYGETIPYLNEFRNELRDWNTRRTLVGHILQSGEIPATFTLTLPASKPVVIDGHEGVFLYSDNDLTEAVSDTLAAGQENLELWFAPLEPPSTQFDDICAANTVSALVDAFGPVNAHTTIYDQTVMVSDSDYYQIGGEYVYVIRDAGDTYGITEDTFFVGLADGGLNAYVWMNVDQEDPAGDKLSEVCLIPDYGAEYEIADEEEDGYLVISCEADASDLSFVTRIKVWLDPETLAVQREHIEVSQRGETTHTVDTVYTYGGSTPNTWLFDGIADKREVTYLWYEDDELQQQTYKVPGSWQFHANLPASFAWDTAYYADLDLTIPVAEIIPADGQDHTIYLAQPPQKQIETSLEAHEFLEKVRAANTVSALMARYGSVRELRGDIGDTIFCTVNGDTVMAERFFDANTGEVSQENGCYRGIGYSAANGELGCSIYNFTASVPYAMADEEYFTKNLRDGEVELLEENTAALRFRLTMSARYGQETWTFTVDPETYVLQRAVNGSGTLYLYSYGEEAEELGINVSQFDAWNDTRTLTYVVEWTDAQGTREVTYSYSVPRWRAFYMVFLSDVSYYVDDPGKTNPASTSAAPGDGADHTIYVTGAVDPEWRE